MPTPLGLITCGSPFPHATQARPVRQGIPRSPLLDWRAAADAWPPIRRQGRAASPFWGSLTRDGGENEALIPSDPQALDQ
ncbi:hypothetical protein ACVW0Q_002267 [Thermostichus sp. MS-CIW-21]|uniref:hypothetical protein n=1 Tax=unclassified Synechococcus TaxID=2626047 RepID=UPI0000694262|nr:MULTISPECIES: hypothetical protein [unclassified Synechococcus]ABC99188.1 hypothetical protein CYA_0988 [Synechococcus sp. JA-3-3Ab]